MCDEELFEEPIVPRRYLWQRVFFVSDPDAIKRVFLDNVENYPRVPLHPAAVSGQPRDRLARDRGRVVVAAPADRRAGDRSPRDHARHPGDDRRGGSGRPAPRRLRRGIRCSISKLVISDLLIDKLWNEVVTGGEPGGRDDAEQPIAKYPRKPGLLDFTPVQPAL